MNKAVIGALVMTVFTRQALGHGAVTKPMPRAVTGHQWCPWCVGEHHPDTNPYGNVHHDAMPSSPCLGSMPGDSPYEPVHYSGYRDLTEEGEPSYAAGGALDARILLDADHAGEARWSYCPHSEDQTEDCFRQRPLTDWIDVHAFWGGASTQDHWKDGEDFPQTVNLPAGMPSGPTTLRWLWICKFTDEIFASCLDTTITGGASTSSTSAMTTTTTTGSGETTATTSSGDTTSTTSSSGERDCIWTEPAGREVKRVSREEKDGRICWDVRVEAGTTVYYQSNTDIYISWNTMPCCLSAASTFGSDSGGNEANIVAFNNSIGSFGFCECTAWDPNNPDASCSGGAAATSMVCPVNGASDGMCPGASDWDGIPVACTPPYTGSTTSTTTTTSMSTSDFELLSDADQACRGISSSDNSDSYYNLHSGVGSLGECQAKCIELSNLCQGIEYNRATGRCEVWTRSGGIQATQSVSGYSCYLYIPNGHTAATSTAPPASQLEPVNGGTNQACRGASSSDNLASYYTVHAGLFSLSECHAKCAEVSNVCQGIEHNSESGRCEVWTRAGGIQATRTVTGYSCYRYNPDAETGTTITSIVTTTVTTAQAATTSTTGDVASCGQMNDHCGGQHFQGTECCVSGLICKQRDDHYSQCEKDGSSTYLCAQIWEQCGGNGWTGATCCAEGLSCVADNAYYSQCQRVSLVQRAVMDSRRLRGPRSRRSLSKALMANPMLVQKASKIIASQAKHAEF